MRRTGKLKGWLPPSSGFVLLCAVLVASVTLFAWGLAQPRLDAVWQAEIELRLGTRDALSAREFQRFQSLLHDYPSYASHLTEGKTGALISANASGVVDVGYAYIVRTRASPGETLQASVLDKKKKIEIKVKGGKISATGTVKREEPWLWTLPEEGPFPQLIELGFSDKVPIDLKYSPELDQTHSVDPESGSVDRESGSVDPNPETDTADPAGGDDS